MTPVAAFDQLSPRERECLRLVAQFKTSKEIERELGIAKSTIDGYLAEAIRKLAARDRRHAALLLATHEGTSTPAESGPDPTRVAAPVGAVPATDPPGGRSDWRSVLPVRRKGARHNPLSPQQRVLWIVLLAAGIMISFGMLVSGLAALTEVLKATGLLGR